jgi:hypothetical protein
MWSDYTYFFIELWITIILFLKNQRIKTVKNTFTSKTKQRKLVFDYVSPTLFCKLIIHQCRWSKIAKHLPGRTDNEIKNYWRTRIQKHIKQAENSQQQSSSDIQINDNDNQIASTSQISAMPEPMDTNIISPPSYQGILEPFPNQFPTISDQSSCCTNNDNNYWSMEDLLSLQLLNGD